MFLDDCACSYGPLQETCLVARWLVAQSLSLWDGRVSGLCLRCQGCVFWKVGKTCGHAPCRWTSWMQIAFFFFLWKVWWLIIMYHLNWAIGCPDIWPNIILGMSVTVFLDEINIWICRLSKAYCPVKYGEGPNSQKPNRPGVRGNPSCLTAFPQGLWSSPAFGLELKHWFFLYLDPTHLQTGIYPLSSPGSPACRYWVLSAFISTWTNSLW